MMCDLLGVVFDVSLKKVLKGNDCELVLHDFKTAHSTFRNIMSFFLSGLNIGAFKYMVVVVVVFLTVCNFVKL